MGADRDHHSGGIQEQMAKEKIMSHEKARQDRQLHSLHRALAVAEADIIARKGPDWNKKPGAAAGGIRPS